MRFATLRVTPLPAVAFFLLVVIGVCFGELPVASSALTTALSSHVLNVTLSGAGAGSNWPTTTNALSAITPTVNATVCSALPSGVSHCDAFLIRVSETTLGLQLSIVTSTALAGNSTYYLLSQWVHGNSTSISTTLARLTSACATALGTSLSSLAVTTGAYAVPCRNSETYSYLPACAAAEVPVTTVYILAPSSDLQAYFVAYLCGPTPTETCRNSIVVQLPSELSPYTFVSIKGLPKALEAVLAYVADVRAGFAGMPQAVGPRVGNTAAAVTARAVELRYRGMHAVLFSTNEKTRIYSSTTRMTIECHASFGYWALVFIAIFPLCAILFRYVWFRGRQRSKKQERRRVVADEMRIMQGCTNPADAPGAGRGPPPGFDTSVAGIGSTKQQWVTDASRNYYDSNAADDNAAAQADAAAHQMYMTPDTGEAHQYVVDDASGAGGAAATAASQPSQQTGNVAGDNAIYQTYVNPETGETYQYTIGATAAGQEQGQTAEASVAEGAQDTAAGDGYQTYVDPSTGETYQYTQINADAAARKYQYVDPVTGTTYQYANPNAAGVYEYVDPTTGETYQYTAEAGENNSTAAEQGHGAAATGNVYVDPQRGEMYRYEAPQQ
ncbi:conserved hypothetical protein [Leishmania infantum JPCM5]|uniref:Uncharacterized protein n=2 Tax=Leishmania infantum TaxID=5671 RepID=A4I9F9_LEIIN|nr:conserved hypothetical protein [Leishmania infantum JPCM5]CAC9534996.1 hypothetical_protein_-_conserved [Leishmania infantum]CAM71462.1 conserved hypothetical protein [Leishmania infantum JPCM5]SUZ45350.1 hypothetical_protein_-_conserved [Leishmania infantum]|eukprot:XP_001468378.1 conserved hypothetical protein [Leishmania infantum JPCM5]